MLERQLLTCALQQQQLADAYAALRQTPTSFHDGVLDALRSPFTAATRGASSPAPWRRAALRSFLVDYFPAYQSHTSFDALWRLLTPLPPSASTSAAADASNADPEVAAAGVDADDAALPLPFETLRDALRRDARARLPARDPFPLEHEQLLDATRARRSDDELELPALQPALSKRSSLPVFATAPAAAATPPSAPPSRQSVAVAGGRIFSPRDGDALSSSSSTAAAAPPLLLDFRSEVLKKSRNWLGRWHTRFLFLRWNELEVCKKNVSATGAPTAAAASAAKSKRYPLHTLLSLQIVQLSESDPSKKQALSLHFKQPTANGGNTTKSLTLGCDSSAHLKTVVIQIATFALLHGLSVGQDAASLHKFLQVGANLDVYCVVPSPSMPPFALSPLQLAFLQSDERSAQAFEATIQLLVRAGADARSVLQWKFATHVLFSPAYGGGPDSAMLARRLLMVRESIVGVVFPFGGVVADDEYQWTLLMYFCCYGELDAARQLLATFLKISKTKCLKYVDHVNAAGDNALHVAIKAARRHARAEELAMLLVDVGTNGASFLANAADASAGDAVPSAAPALASSASSIDSQLIHCSDRSGESVVHLALKARLWRLVDKLVDCRAIDPTSCDRHGNNSLHVAIKVGAPMHLVARIIQLYRPQRASAFSSMSTERSNLVTTLGYDSRDRRGNDTPLTLALKHRQQEVVELLLAAGASPNTGECAWAIDVALADTPAASGIGRIGDGDAPLHVAIKSGLHHAAMSLVSHGAHLQAVDSNGASSLALAIRFGMYALGVKIAKKVASTAGGAGASGAGGGAGTREREQKQWMDLESGAPVCLLAIKAGQVELVAMLLDLCDAQMHLSHHATKETLLHLLVKNVCWLELSGGARDGEIDAQQQQQQSEEDEYESSRLQFYSDMLSPTKRKRNRLKSRSEGDLRYLRLSLLAAATPHKHASQTLKKVASGEIAAVELPSRQAVLKKVEFFQDAEVALIRGILQRSSDVAGVSSASKSQQQSLSAWASSFHLATVPSLVVTDHSIDSYTPLHIAAAGGEATSSALSLLLAFLFLRCTSPSRLEVVQALAKPTGASSETPLHAALASNSPSNALLILCAARVASGKQRFEAAEPSEKDAVGPDATRDAEQVKMLCARMYEAESVPSGSTPLHLACMWPQNAGMLQVMELLFDEDVYAGNWDADGLAPLHVALQSSCDERLIELFKRHRQDLNTWTEGAAGLAAKRGSGSSRQLSVLDAIESDAEVAASVPKTALMLAIEHENVAAFRELVRCGAQLRVVTPKTRLGLLHFAVQCKVRSKELLQTLLGCSKLVGHQVTDCYGRTTAEVVQSLEELLQVVDEELPVSADGEFGGFVRRRTSAVLEEPDEDEASGSKQTSRVQDTASGSQVDASGVVLEVAPPSSTQLAPSQLISISYSPPPSSDEHRVQSSAGVVFPATRQQPFAGPSRAHMSLTSSATVAGAQSAADPRARSPSRAPQQATARHLQGLPDAPSLDSAAIEFLREEERATLTLVAHEARQEAKDWLKKRIGQKKLLSDARAQLQSLQKHRRTGSGTVPAPTRVQDGDGPTFGQESERQLEQYKALAAKKFIDKHVSEAVAEARMEIEREKQAIFQDTGLYPGRTTTKFANGVAPHRRGEVLHRSASSNSSMLGASSLAHRSESNATLLSDESVASVWWSERGGTSFDDLTGTWLSTPGGARGGTMLSEGWNGTWLSSMRGTGIEYRDSRLSSTFHSVMEAESNDPYGVDGLPGVSYAPADASRKDGDDEREEGEEDWDDEYMNPLDRDSFSHVIETRNSLS